MFCLQVLYQCWPPPCRDVLASAVIQWANMSRWVATLFWLTRFCVQNQNLTHDRSDARCTRWGLQHTVHVMRCTTQHGWWARHTTRVMKGATHSAHNNVHNHGTGDRRNARLGCSTGNTMGFFCHTAPTTHHTTPAMDVPLMVMGSTHGFTLKPIVLTPQD